MPDVREAKRKHTGSTAATVEAAHHRRNAYALVIGINRYQDQAIRDLRYACADAEAIYKVLVNPEEGLFTPEKVTLLLNEEATERSIRKTISSKLSRYAGEQDIVLLYYAGHGAPVIDPAAGSRDGFDKYLVPADAELDDLRGTGIPMHRLGEWFEWIASRRVLVFIDSCYSGLAGGRGPGGGRTFESPYYQPRASLSEDFLDQLADEGRLIITACGVNEVALEIPEKRHGLFTYHLVEGLKGAADADREGRIGILELYKYIYDNVSRDARILSGSMHPVLKGSLQGALYLGRRGVTSSPQLAPGTGWIRERLKDLDPEKSPAETQKVARDLFDKSDREALAGTLSDLHKRFHHMASDPVTQVWIVSTIGKAGTDEAIDLLHSLSQVKGLHVLVQYEINEAIKQVESLRSRT